MMDRIVVILLIPCYICLLVAIKKICTFINGYAKGFQKAKDLELLMLEGLLDEINEQYYINRHELHDDFLNKGLDQASDIICKKISELRGNENE